MKARLALPVWVFRFWMWFNIIFNVEAVRDFKQFFSRFVGSVAFNDYFLGEGFTSDHALAFHSEPAEHYGHIRTTAQRKSAWVRAAKPRTLAAWASEILDKEAGL